MTSNHSTEQTSVDRLDLVPEPHRRERLFLLDVLAGRAGMFDVDAGAFRAIAPKKLHPFLFARLRDAQLPTAGCCDALSRAYRRDALQKLRRGAELRRIDAAPLRGEHPLPRAQGAVLAPLVYPDRAVRTMTALDFLIAEEDMPRAMGALEGAGYFMLDSLPNELERNVSEDHV